MHLNEPNYENKNECVRPLANKHDTQRLDPHTPLRMLTELARQVRLLQPPAPTQMSTQTQNTSMNERHPPTQLQVALTDILGWVWGHTRAWAAYPQVFGKSVPIPVPVKTCTLRHGYGFTGVQVWVALGNPRVTCANPYLSKHLQIMCMGFGLISIAKNAHTRSSHLLSKFGFYI